MAVATCRLILIYAYFDMSRYSTAIHGASLLTLLALSEESPYKACMIVIKDTIGYVSCLPSLHIVYFIVLLIQYDSALDIYLEDLLVNNSSHIENTSAMASALFSASFHRQNYILGAKGNRSLSNLFWQM